jgi:hypothetical protein
MRKRLVRIFLLLVCCSKELIFCGVAGVAYYVAFGPHGPRAPTSQPGDNLKIFLATMGLVGVATVIAAIVHKSGGFYSRLSAPLYNIIRVARLSSTSTKDFDERMGRGYQRTRAGNEDQPYQWYVSLIRLLHAYTHQRPLSRYLLGRLFRERLRTVEQIDILYGGVCHTPA